MSVVVGDRSAWLLAQAEQQSSSLREGMGNLLFTIVFILLLIVVVIWWLKRNYG